MADPFQAGYMVGLEERRMQNEEKYKQGLLERLRQETEMTKWRNEQEKSSAAAPGELLQGLAPKDTGPLTAAPVPGKINNDPAMGPNGSGWTGSGAEAKFSAPVAPTDPNDPLRNTSKIAPGEAQGILSEYTSLGTGGPVKPTLEEKLQKLAFAAAKAPDKQQALMFVAGQDPDIRNYMQEQALKAKMGEEDLKLKYKKLEKEFDTEQDIKKEGAKQAWETLRDVDKRKLDVQKLDDGSIVIIDPYDKTGKPFTSSIVRDPEAPGGFLFKSQKGVPELEEVKALLRQAPDSKNFDDKQLTAMAKQTMGNPAALKALVNQVGAMHSQNPAGKSEAKPKVDGGGSTESAYNALMEVISPKPKMTPGTQVVPKTDSAPEFLKVTPKSPTDPVAPGQKKTYIEQMSERAAGVTPQEQKTTPSVQAESAMPPSDQYNRSSDLFLSKFRKSTTVAKAKADLQKAFPKLTEQQIEKILVTVTKKDSSGTGQDMVDLEKLRDNLDALYQQATAPTGAMRKGELSSILRD